MPERPFDADVIVAGAGPAGAVAARTLAAAGIDTLIVDRATFPRNKPCGGGISARVLTRFRWLRAILPQIDVHTAKQLHLQSPDGSVLRMYAPEPAVLLIRRFEFDDLLRREAIRCGARFHARFEISQVHTDGSGVTIRSRSGAHLRGTTLIAADGVNSVVAKRLGINVRWGKQSLALDLMEETSTEILRPTDPDVLWVSYAHGGLDGYAYIFPKTNHVNVGIGCLLSRFQDNAEARPYQLQARLVRDLTNQGQLVGRSDPGNFTPFLIPVGGPLRKPHQGRVLVAGDAAGFVNAFTAEGIYYAMVSGELAGRAVTLGKTMPEAVRVYDRLWRRELWPELRDSVLIQKYLFADRRRVDRVVRSGAASTTIRDLLLGYVQGHVSYAGLRRRVLCRSPRLLLSTLRTTFGI